MNSKKHLLKCKIESPEEMLALGAALVDLCGNPAVVYLHGDLGAGKTTLVRGFLHALGYLGAVKSPTYTIVELYNIAEKQIFHFDLYRIIDPEELENIGIRDYFAQPAICLIEWPEKASGFLPKANIECIFEILDQGRIVTILQE